MKIGEIALPCGAGLAPMAGVTDAAMRLLGLFEALNRLGTTVVVATHDIHLISRIENAQMMRLEKGRLSDPTGALRYPPNRA